jgi:hypothetical protein
LLSLLAGMDETAKLFQQGYSSGGGGTQFIVREAEVERAPEIAGEFYPNGNAACTELAEAAVSSNGDDELVSKICELAHQLGYNRAKTKMLLGQWAGNLLGLERSLLSEVEGSHEESPNSLSRASGREATSPGGCDLVEEKVIRQYE